jgi:electron transfer flavoprotein alpha subunit
LAERWLLWLEADSGGALSPVSASVLEAAIFLAGRGNVSAALLFDGKTKPDDAFPDGALKGLARLYLFLFKKTRGLRSDVSSWSLLEAARLERPAVILAGADEIGREAAPRVAAALGCGLTADCTALGLEGGRLIQTRPAYGGDVIASIMSKGPGPQMATVGGRVELPELTREEGRERLKAPSAARNPERVILDAPLGDPRIRVLKRELVKPDLSLETAKIVVAAGLGVGGPEGAAKAKDFAGKIGAELGATRALVEKGWLPPDRQIGLSGRHVAPDLLIALGVSGSTQFMAGIRGAKRIVAVNIDPEAPILGAAETALCLDLEALWPALAKGPPKPSEEGA